MPILSEFRRTTVLWSALAVGFVGAGLLFVAARETPQFVATDSAPRPVVMLADADVIWNETTLPFRAEVLYQLNRLQQTYPMCNGTIDRADIVRYTMEQTTQPQFVAYCMRGENGHTRFMFRLDGRSWPAGGMN